MSTDEQRGVVFPAAGDGRRSTAALGRAVAADALRPVDPAGALAAEQETNWRSGYLIHFRRLVEAGLASRRAALEIAGAGLASVHDRMRVAHRGRRRDGPRRAGHRARRPPAGDGGGAGPGAAGEGAVAAVPRREARAATRWPAGWTPGSTAGVVEPSAAEAVRTVQANPDWLRLPDHTVAVLGAGAEIGPLPSLLRWGVRVAAVDLPRPASGSGCSGCAAPARCCCRSRPATTRDRWPAGPAPTWSPTCRRWPTGSPGCPAGVVLGNYVYADGATNVRVSVAVDALTVRLQQARDDVALGFLATPTDVFAVPRAAVEQSVRGYAARSAAAKLLGRPLRRLSAAGCCAAATGPAPTPASTTAWCRSRGRTTRWPSGCSGGGRRWPGTPGPPSRSTWPRRPGPGRC